MKQIGFLGIEKCRHCGQWELMGLVERGIVEKKYFVVCRACQSMSRVTTAEKDALLNDSRDLPDPESYARMWAAFWTALGETSPPEEMDGEKAARIVNQALDPVATNLKSHYPAHHVEAVRTVAAMSVLDTIGNLITRSGQN